ncbi:methyltransferase, putative [Plasmodium knowlesi strain H]|uniref:Methyltransferase, putative n=2 Tax=Plasmodium knowlesi (strain H) TaxID=5851 RepID=A0A5K1U4R0_PLAKH|nr:rRNA (cytosine-C(5))-methyltransferase, putative [Plasmodium knowlesi strain H]CAA9988321.1 rRNA (cytosine-C(5))-methyltransferase, putative [Plasmodium knowlesi strain H]SBO20196.1 methyltransferase, putative [Plasmodium knowlesi strain H]SBO20270.1 methyltransferase, putative [Plasmodium knowlesi strain H]VVS77795.1 rRNA (cytosine-C(5))-methyltransferase, putative [Plasmodium knowlesi strain H]|eukprot:XP_002259300.1 methyltransferase, putative [Plasmodium knowlesi strain H]
MENNDEGKNAPREEDVQNGESGGKTFALFENENFELNASDDEFESGSAEGDDAEDGECTEEVDQDDGDESGSQSEDMSYGDLSCDGGNDDEDEEDDDDDNDNDGDGKGENPSGEDGNDVDEEDPQAGDTTQGITDVRAQVSGMLKRKNKKKWINQEEQIYKDEIGVYRKGKLMKSEDIEDRMKYLLLLFSEREKVIKLPSAGGKAKVNKASIVKELLFYYTYFYEYSEELIKYLYYLFDLKELYWFLEMNNLPKEIHLRTNTVKITRKNLMNILKSQNINAEEGENWNNVGIVINDVNSNVGSLNEYMYGYYMIQSASSLIPVLELNVQPDDTVLDMCAAPGGKCTFICALQKNRGFVYANDINKMRCKAIEANASRMGIHNLVITSFDALKVGQKWNFLFDKIILDAPCSGTGVVNKNKGARRKTLKEIRELAQKQRKLLNNAISLVKNGGIVVYSTCSITVEENEQVINYILKKRDVNILPLDTQIGDPGITHYRKKEFSSKVSLCRRIYLHKHNYDNFFVAKLWKRSDAVYTKGGVKSTKNNNMVDKNVRKNNDMVGKNDHNTEQKGDGHPKSGIKNKKKGKFRNRKGKKKKEKTGAPSTIPSDKKVKKGASFHKRKTTFNGKNAKFGKKKKKIHTGR